MKVKEALNAIRALLAESPAQTEPAEEGGGKLEIDVKAEEIPAAEVAEVVVEAADVPPADPAVTPDVAPEDTKYTELEQRVTGFEQKLNEIIQRMNGMQGVMMKEDAAPIKKAITELAAVIEAFAELPTEEPTEKPNSFQLPKKADRLAEIAENVKAAKEMIKK